MGPDAILDLFPQWGSQPPLFFIKPRIVATESPRLLGSPGLLLFTAFLWLLFPAPSRSEPRSAGRLAGISGRVQLRSYREGHIRDGLVHILEGLGAVPSGYRPAGEVKPSDAKLVRLICFSCRLDRVPEEFFASLYRPS